MTLPTVQNPNWSGTPVVIGGVTLITTRSEQSSGVEGATRTLEKGSEIAQRNVTQPESGTITGATDASGLSGLYNIAQKRQPISITTPEGTIPQCYVSNVSRTREGGDVNKYDVTVEWNQIKLATLSSVSITATTGDGKKSQNSGGILPSFFSGSDSQQSGGGGGGGGGGESIIDTVADAFGF